MPSLAVGDSRLRLNPGNVGAANPEGWDEKANRLFS
jgi:hypothetical protein